ncbi:hypothetical protein, partial [Altericroceibacterium spongiae]|uniref:hypothetical protein n=1 Tax=Altericroceibacterium spongiae TaxID=2320269 RepID=UPI001AECBAFA
STGPGAPSEKTGCVAASKLSIQCLHRITIRYSKRGVIAGVQLTAIRLHLKCALSNFNFGIVKIK